MNIRSICLAIALIALVPFGATAQVDAGDYDPVECDTERGAQSGTEVTLHGTGLTGEGIVNE